MVSLFHLCFFLFVFCFTRSQNLSPRHNCPIFVWIMKSCLQERVWKWCPEFLKACKGFMFVCIPCSLFYCIFWYTKTSHLKQFRGLKSSPAIPLSIQYSESLSLLSPGPGDSRGYISMGVYPMKTLRKNLCLKQMPCQQQALSLMLMCRLTSVLSINWIEDVIFIPNFHAWSVGEDSYFFSLQNQRPGSG